MLIYMLLYMLRKNHPRNGLKNKGLSEKRGRQKGDRRLPKK